MGARERVAPVWLRLSWSSRGTRQSGMTIKECGKTCPARMQGSGGVLGAKRWSSIHPMTEVGEGTVGSEYEVRIQKVAPVFIRNETYPLPSLLPWAWSVIPPPG